MTPKEQLREKFIEILPVSLCETGEFTDTLLALLAAVDEIIGKPIQVFVAPTEEQLEKLREAIRKDTSILIYGEPR